MTKITKEYLHELFDYRDGELVWKLARQRIRVGAVAGTINSKGYRNVKINGQCHQAHRLIWLYHYGQWPAYEIDHINRDRVDNRIENLREATRAENGRNKSKHSNNTSGVTGVYWQKRDKKWHAQIKLGGQNQHLGYFDTLDEAGAARKVAEQKYFGEFVMKGLN